MNKISQLSHSITKCKSVCFRASKAACLVATIFGLTQAMAAAQSQQLSPPAIVDSSSLEGKVMCGYQGWFCAPGDASGRGWVHWGRAPMGPGDATVDLWPDMTDYAQNLRYPTGFKNTDGSAAEVFSSQDAGTVDLHFKWMREYGIDGVFLQRFASLATNPVRRQSGNRVLENVRASAQKYGRVYGVMYDLSGVRSGGIDPLIADWKELVDTYHMTKDSRYIREHGKPVVALWGIGFSGSRDPLLGDGLKFIDFLKNDPIYGGNAVMIGVPEQWRTVNSTAVPNDKMLQVVEAADIVSPWAVGTCSTPAGAIANAQKYWQPDFVWCQSHNVAYMPVVFPGFTWHNLRKGASPANQIPRLGGRFLWTQYSEARKLSISMVYQAMFDEVDEGTAILKVTNTPPDGQGQSVFTTYEGLPSDFYLRLVGEATRMIHGDIGPDDESLIGKYGTTSPDK